MPHRFAPLALALSAAILPAAARSAVPDTGLGGLGGPPLPGVCLLSREGLFSNAKVGQAISARLKTLTDQAQAEIDADRAKVDADLKALQDQKASLPAAEFQSRQQAIGSRLTAVQQKAQLRSREIDATRAKALASVSEQAQPLIADAYQIHHCSMLLNREAVLGGNAAGDLTPVVIKALDGKLTTMTFEREVLAGGPAIPGAVKR